MNKLFNEQEMMRKHGWFTHAVCCGDDTVNYHTHGLEESFNHKDLQITIPMNPKVAHQIFFSAIKNIKKGKKYKEDIRYDDVLVGYDVMFKKFIETGRVVLRIILPDKNGKFPCDEGCDLVFIKQYENVHTKLN